MAKWSMVREDLDVLGYGLGMKEIFWDSKWQLISKKFACSVVALKSPPMMVGLTDEGRFLRKKFLIGVENIPLAEVVEGR